MYNIVDMCWVNKFPSQKEMYVEMLKNKQSGLVGCMEPIDIDESFDDTSKAKDRGFTERVKPNINRTFDSKSRSQSMASDDHARRLSIVSEEKSTGHSSRRD